MYKAENTERLNGYTAIKWWRPVSNSLIFKPMLLINKDVKKKILQNF